MKNTKNNGNPVPSIDEYNNFLNKIKNKLLMKNLNSGKLAAEITIFQNGVETSKEHLIKNSCPTGSSCCGGDWCK